MKKIIVIAVGEARTPLRDELGRWEPGQYVGRDASGNPLAHEVDDTEQVRRALVRGDLAEVVTPTFNIIEGTVRQVLAAEAPADPPGTEPLPTAERPTPTPEEG